MPACFRCESLIDSIHGLQIHFKTTHRGEVFSHYQCREENCFSNFANWSQFRRHLNKFHRAVDLFPQADSNIKSSNKDFITEQDVPMNNVDHDYETVEQEPEKTARDFKADLHGFIFQYMGELYADPRLPRSQVQEGVDSAEALIHKISSALLGNILSVLDGMNADITQKCQVTQMFDVLNDCFNDFRTEHRRLKLMTSSRCLFYPEKFTIGYSTKKRKRNNQFVTQIVPMTGQFVPLRKIFKMFFSLPNVFEQTKAYMEKLESETNVISNFVQGKLWRTKKNLFFPGKIVFPLFVYYSDLEVNNLVGSHKCVSKIGATYVTIACLPPEFRSKLENIFLAQLSYSLDRAMYGNKAVFQLLVDEINFLQRTGISLNISGAKVRVYFALGLIIGDNLGLNGILGYVESFRANYFCRFCKSHREQTYVECVEKPEVLRKVEEYQNDVESPVEDCGVKEKSVWNDIDYFHVYENYSSDPLLHELAEGAGKRAMRRLVYHFVFEVKLFSLSTLNARLKCFPFTLSGISNKPPLISETELAKKKIYMSGSEMITFILVFGLLVADFVQPDDSYWELYLILREILEIVSAKSVQLGYQNLLKCLVSDYNRLYRQLLNENLKPKEHIMTHWPLIMTMSGPLSLISSMRMEAKHRLFKLRANATSSRVDIIYTTALKEQLQFAFRLASKRGLTSNFGMGPATSLYEDDSTKLPHYLDCVSKDVLETCVDVPWVEVRGTLYKVGMFLALNHNEYDFPVFGEVINILCTEQENVIFVCNVFDNIGFDYHFCSYFVEKTENFVSINQNDFLSHQPAIHQNHPNGKEYVFLR